MELWQPPGLEEIFNAFVQLLLADKGFHFLRTMKNEARSIIIDYYDKSYTKTLNLVTLGDRRSHRGERYEFQIATKAEESYGFALQTCVKVTNIKYKKKVSVQQCPLLSKSRYYCGYFA